MGEFPCPKYDGCDVPLCPLDQPEDLVKHTWYPDEPICSRRKYARLSWIRTQRRIAKLQRGPETGYFTKPMLDVLNRVHKQVRGANPDMEKSESRWFRARARAKAERDRNRQARILSVN